MAINTYPYPLGGSNGQHRGSTTQTSSSTTIGTGAGNLGTNTATGGAGGITQSINVAPGGTYTNQGTGLGSVGGPGLTFPGTLGTMVISHFHYIPPKDEGIRAGEITGYRAWHITNLINGMKLMSVFASHLWTPGALEKSDRDVDDCITGTGFHAFTTPENCLREYGLGLITTIGVVYGEIKMWGKVIEHERGYRSEYCKIIKLSDILVHHNYDPIIVHHNYDPDLILNDLCKTYGVERGQPWGTVQTPYYKGVPRISTIVDSRTWTGLD